MRFDEIEVYAANAAKEIVIAKMSNLDISINVESGKKIAEFYDEIYKGIAKTLKNSPYNLDISQEKKD